MKTKTTIKALFLAVAACFMSMTVILSAAHAKDVVNDHSHDVTAVGRASDTTMKVLGDMHIHIDKQTVKNISMDNPVTAREREIKALNEEKTNRNFLEVIEDFLAFYRMAFTMRFSLALA